MIPTCMSLAGSALRMALPALASSRAALGAATTAAGAPRHASSHAENTNKFLFEVRAGVEGAHPRRGMTQHPHAATPAVLRCPPTSMPAAPRMLAKGVALSVLELGTMQEFKPALSGAR